ncbi:unnamed protein product [Nezara viridula]|uniref:Uncharacterized protein n=1 Tax=Nezara viridula TaxID=85310 RepID=A0A9P0DX00_NEZVI|nr:unnamed protein product [Nezara viridula]
MGICHCKNKGRNSRRRELDGASHNAAEDRRDTALEQDWWKSVSPKDVEMLILDSLKAIRSLVENDQEPPQELFKLHNIADQDDGWIQIVDSMVRVVPVEDPLGPAVITLLLDDCPLPNKNAVLRLSSKFNLSSKNRVSRGMDNRKPRNICIALGVLAEKLSGPSSVAILTSATLDFLIGNLEDEIDPVVTLFSLIALEKFAQTSENKVTIKRRLAEAGDPLLRLEARPPSSDLIESQVKFCATWALDNLFLVEGRKFSYETVDVLNINAMLNTKDVSEYLKISPDGLEARCDAYSFESVRCTFPATEGVWFYEVLLLTPGVMQIGWALKHSKFLNHEGYGIGDDEYSVAYDGCRELVWFAARSQEVGGGRWKAGDIVGTLLDIPAKVLHFYLNGVQVFSSDLLFTVSANKYFAGASFMSFQQCRFNFGSDPFRFPPDTEFKSFNDYASLSPQERIVLPRHLEMEALRNMSIREDSCAICFDSQAETTLIPCGHSGFCQTCTAQLFECPMCRAKIDRFTVDPT